MTERLKKQKKIWPFVVMGVVVLALVGISDRLKHRPAPPPFVHEFMIFGTYGRVTFWAPAQDAAAAAAEMVQELEALQSAINTYEADSDISRLNRTAHEAPFHCGDRLWNMIAAGRDAYTVSEGAFDISVGPLLKLWGFYGKRQTLPSDEEIAQAAELTGLDNIIFDPQEKTVLFPKQGMFLDFGGIAKGYALDLCLDIAEKHGLSQGMIDLGGNIGCLPDPPPGKDTYTIGIRDPAATGEILETVSMTGLCVATSGNYERFQVLDGTFIHHIIDPATGWPVPARASVSVIAPRGLDTDVFSTAIFVRGDALAKRFIDQEPRGRALIITAADSAAEPMTIQRLNWPAEDRHP
ncbi:MAG: FAD:protein FMN transferase [Lentisphaeria bacterium]|nr:FAD:protein FMN transferase [Lentisphaeria bacterium]